MRASTTPSSKRPTPTSHLSDPTTSRKHKVAKTLASAKGTERGESEKVYQPNQNDDEVPRNEEESQLVGHWRLAPLFFQATNAKICLRP